MLDRELLELAAKAAGVELDWDIPPNSCSPWRMTGEGDDRGPASEWNPLTDDGDALRLLVKLGMQITEVYFYHDECMQTPSSVRKSGGGKLSDIVISFPTYKDSFKQYDPNEATRRAIVRTAAEIGLAIKSELP